jgi:hypothetical protein
MYNPMTRARAYMSQKSRLGEYEDRRHKHSADDHGSPPDPE